METDDNKQPVNDTDKEEEQETKTSPESTKSITGHERDLNELKTEIDSSKSTKKSEQSSVQDHKKKEENCPVEPKKMDSEKEVEPSKIKIESTENPTNTLPLTAIETSSASMQQTPNISNDNNQEIMVPVDQPMEVAPIKRRGPRRRRKIEYLTDDPEILKQQKTDRSVELRLKNLKWTLNQPCEVSGKRQKKAPERFELALLTKRKSQMDDAEGSGDALGSIPWIVQHVRDANIYTLRMLHRAIFRKQGMFSEKHIRKSVLSFRGFPFEESSSEILKRRMPLEKANAPALAKLCNVLGIKSGEKETMIDDILKFLHTPSNAQVDEYLKGVFISSQQMDQLVFPKTQQFSTLVLPAYATKNIESEESSSSEDSSVTFGEDKIMTQENFSIADTNLVTGFWKRPNFFVDGTGIKLKLIKPIIANIQVATDNFIELLHQLLFLNVDEKRSMRRNILEFNGFTHEPGSTEHISRMTLLTRFPLDQIKFICRVLCLPTWHRPRQALIDGIISFLACPSLAAIKKSVGQSPAKLSPLLLGDTKFQMPDVSITEIKSEETEEIEIVPDIHLHDDIIIDKDDMMNDSPPCEEEVIDVKLKNFPNIHYQIICTPAAKLNDLHVVLYLRPCPLNNVRKNILDFSHFPFDEHSSEYHSRRVLLERMSLQSLKMVVTVLCLTQYVVDLNKSDIVQAILKFLMKPSTLLHNSNTAVQSPLLVEQRPLLIQALGTPKSKTLSDIVNESVAQNQKVLFSCPRSTGEISIQPIKAAFPTAAEARPKSLPKKIEEITKRALAGCSQIQSLKSISLTPVVMKREPSNDLDVPLAKVQKSVQKIAAKLHAVESDDEEDDEPLSKFVGHPNDDQLRTLITKVIKESKLEDITMKHVIRSVFNTYPNFDLGYRREFIKSVVRQLLSQMDEQRCSVSTTVLTI